MKPLRWTFYRQENGTVTVRLDFKDDSGGVSSSFVNYPSVELAKKGLSKMHRDAETLSAEVLEEEPSKGKTAK